MVLTLVILWYSEPIKTHKNISYRLYIKILFTEQGNQLLEVKNCAEMFTLVYSDRPTIDYKCSMKFSGSEA